MKSKLKSLELHGFKTFANRTIFEYPAEITAIVGPNGSGKSNIADALRWVLGEQSYSLLRGRKTEDMVFAGSEERARASMAQATLTFDNEDGWLPIEFTEVTIARRAYRDGQNEYFLNGQRVRLKEIYELLALSGLSQRTYTIIGQGLVDAALSLKPEERRRFFEEAAGIGLYRTRREEALNRLEDTRRNLERLHDIVLELEPRLRSLEKQAQRAQEYERVKADLQVLLREWYGYHWNRTQIELTNAHDVQGLQEKRLEKSQERFAEVEDQMNRQRVKLQELRSQLNTLHTQSSETHTQREKVSRNLAVMLERQSSIFEQKKSLESDQLRMESEHQTRLARLENIKQEEQDLLEELAESQTQKDNAQNILRARMSEREQLENAKHKTRAKQVISEKRKVELGAHQAELENRTEMLTQSLGGVRKSLEAELVSSVNTAERLKLAALHQETSDQTLKDAVIKLKLQRERMADLESGLKKMNEDLGVMKADRARFFAQYEVLEQSERSESGLNQGAQFLLEASRKGQLAGKYHAFSHLLNVPKEYEIAIAAVLGEFVDSVFLDEATDPEHALDLLEGNGKGRAVLLPQTPRHNEPEFKPAMAAKVIGIAADLVTGETYLDPVIHMLLGNVLIVRDRQAARQLVADLPAQARVVTLKGEIFWGNGVIAAGQDNRAGVIARPRQMRELQNAIGNIEKEIDHREQQVVELRKTLEEQRSLENSLINEFQENQQEASNAAQQHQRASLEFRQLEQSIEFQRLQISQVGEQLKQTRETQNKCTIEIKQLDAELSDLQLNIRNFNRQLAEIPIEETQAQVAHWNTSNAVIKKTVENKTTQREEYQTGLRADTLRLESLSERMGNLSNTALRLDAEMTELHNQEHEFNELIYALQAQIEPSELALNTLEHEYTQTQNNQIAAQQAVTVAERYAAQAQIDVTKYREALDSLRRRIEDDFGLVAFQYTTDILSPTPLPLEGMVEQLPKVISLSPEIEENVSRHRAQLRRMGAVNIEARIEYETVKERYDYLSGQIEDLRKADSDLRQVISELDELMKKEFRKTFNAVAAEFRHIFTRLFGGGSARLVLVDEENPSETGVEIEARLPGRREQGLLLLSGGERSLTAVALIFSLLKVSPTPFCVLDEVDAMLDEANVGRFCELLRELSLDTQFVIITHNRNTVQISDVIYGVTMGRDSASQVISLKLDEVDQMVK